MTKKLAVTIYFDTEAQYRAFRARAGAEAVSMSELGKQIVFEHFGKDDPAFFAPGVDDITYNRTDQATEAAA
jgi:hypothetical protein